MRRLAVIPLTAAGLVVLSVPAAPAVGPPRLSVTPRTVHLGDQVTIRGREWPVIEFCKRRVRLRLESGAERRPDRLRAHQGQILN